MASGFKGTVTEFTTAEQNVSETKISMDTNLNTLRNNLESTRAAWKGDAGDAFQRIMERYDAAGKKMNDALQVIADLLKSAGSKYEAAEAQQNEALSKVTSQFGDRLG